MWQLIASIILRKKWYVISVVISLIIISFFYARKVQMSYELAQMLPQSDSTYKQYNDFKKKFGEDGTVLVVGVTDTNFFQLNHFQYWYDINLKIKRLSGVEEVISPTRIINIVKNDSIKKFSYQKVVSKRPKTQIEVDSIKMQLSKLEFYKGLVYNEDKHLYIMAITLDKKRLNNKSRVFLVDSIKHYINTYSNKFNVKTHISGLPYIRTAQTEKIKDELYLFVILSIIVSFFVLLGLFRSFRSVVASLIVVGISVIFTLGFMGLFHFEITILTGIVPPLLIIIGIENCIFLLNRYLSEYNSHKNKVKALSRIIQRIGTATFLTNLTTAVGFASFIFSPTNILREFGIITSVNIMMEFALSITLIPIILSFLPEPKKKHTKHLESKKVNFLLTGIEKLIVSQKKWVIISFSILLIIGIWGMTQMHISGKMVDDLKKSDPILKDLKYFESNVGGIMPFEILIDTKKKNGVMQLKNIRKMNELQNYINKKYTIFSKPLSIVEAVKFAKQAYYNGNPQKYSIPKNNEATFILSYLPQKGDINDSIAKKNPLHAFVDSAKQTTRISYQMTDVGLKSMKNIKADIQLLIDSLFPKKKYTVQLTGNAVVYTKGTEYLINNLIQSVLLAIFIISLIMGLLFTSFRMIIISVIPNLIPLILVAGIMGIANIPVKPSTIIIFSIALGIAVDNAIHFLTRYRHELRTNYYNVKIAVIKSLYGNGISMLSSLMVLVLGFSIFIFSDFGATQAMGILITTTLIFSIFCNILLLPMLIYSFSSVLCKKSIDKPLLEMFDEPREPSLEELNEKENS